jgi:Ca-activated chloride channel family protein
MRANGYHGWMGMALLILLAAVPGRTADNPDGHRPTFKISVDTVFLNVSVTDPLNRSVTGLNKDDFQIYEDKVQQKICAFEEDPSPVSLGILLDTSGSMKSNNNIQSAKMALRSLMADTVPGDEFFLITFNQDAKLVKSFTEEAGDILGEGALARPSGQTAIWDAVYRGLDLMRHARNPKRALILITDGEDNSSRYSPSEVREFARESSAQIYAIGEQGDLGYGPSEIASVVQLTGGRAFFPNSLNDLDYYVSLIHDELRSQYVLGYVPSHRQHDGKWRKIKVKLDQIKGLPRLVVRSREGYYSARN